MIFVAYQEDPVDHEDGSNKTTSSPAPAVNRSSRTEVHRVGIAMAAAASSQANRPGQGSNQMPRTDPTADDKLGLRSSNHTAKPLDGDGLRFSPKCPDRERLREVLQALPSQSMRELKQAWQTLSGSEPPDKLSRDLLIRVIADKLQTLALGGLAPATTRKLATLARHSEKANGAETAHAILRIKPGTRLVRTWGGKTHTVLVLENGFEHEGKHHSSLTQIADAITGAHWSGPRFFGLTRTKAATTTKEPRDDA
jgi:hypothetical protein